MRFANQRRVVAKLLAIVLITPIALEGGSNWASETTINQTDRDQLQQRGQELRAALQQTYQELLRTKRLNGHRTDITQSVLPYISVGMSFRDAETILHNAGFTIEKPDLDQATNPNRNKTWWYAVVAKIPLFDQGFLFSADAYVVLLPESPDNFHGR